MYSSSPAIHPYPVSSISFHKLRVGTSANSLRNDEAASFPLDSGGNGMENCVIFDTPLSLIGHVVSTGSKFCELLHNAPVRVPQVN